MSRKPWGWPVCFGSGMTVYTTVMTQMGLWKTLNCNRKSSHIENQIELLHPDCVSGIVAFHASPCFFLTPQVRWTFPKLDLPEVPGCSIREPQWFHVQNLVVFCPKYVALYFQSLSYNLTQVPHRHNLPIICESRCTCGRAIWSLNLCLLTLNEDGCSWDGEDVVLTSRLRHIYWFDKVRLHTQTSRCVFVKFKYTKFGIQPINLT